MAFNRKTAIIAGATVATLAAGGGGWALLAGGGGDTIALTASDVVTLEPKDLRATVSAQGTVAAAREISLSTGLTGPVAQLNAKVGDRVQSGQLLAVIDTSGIERDLLAQRATQAAEQQASFGQVETAQQQLRHLQEARDAGLNPELNSAQAAVDSARAEFEAAQAELAHKPAALDAAHNVETARDAVRSANHASLQAGFTSLGATNEGEVPGSNMASALLNWAESDHLVTDAEKNLAHAEESYAQALADIDRDLAAKARTAATAFGSLANAERAQQAAQLSTQHQIDAQSLAVDQALRTAASGKVAADAANSKLEFDLGTAEIRTPAAGVVTAVDAKAGQPASGPLLTVADDSTMHVTVTVKEADLAQVAEGMAVTFTSPSVPNKEFKGTVAGVSPVATSAAPAKDSDSPAPTKPEFAVDVRIEGDREGLRLGSTAKAKIIASEHKDVLAVPNTAIIQEGPDAFVLTLDDADQLTRTPVTVTHRTDFESVITGLDSGTRVIMQADAHQEGIGKHAKIH